MPKITRKTQKIFAENVSADMITAFGSIKANSPNNPVYTKDPDVIQSEAYANEGWNGAVQDDYAPYQQDMNALQFLFSRQLAYLFQCGIPEYDANTQYYANISFCQINGVIYKCITDSIGNLPTTNIGTFWQDFDLSALAPKNSPALTGTPTAPTPAISDNSTKIITSAWFNNKVQLVQALPASPDSNVIYMIPE